MPVRVFITIFNILTMNTIGCEYQIDVTPQTSLHISFSQCSKISKQKYFYLQFSIKYSDLMSKSIVLMLLFNSARCLQMKTI